MKPSRRIPRALGRIMGCAMVTAQLASPVMAQSLSRVAPDAGYPREYSALAEHNIFLRDRAPHPAAAAPVSLGIRPSAEQICVITGIVCNDKQRYVLIENVLDGSVQRLVEGDRIAGGTVIDIAIDGMKFAPDERGGGSITVRSGANLTGAMIESVTAERRRWALRSATGASPTQPAVESGM